MEPASTIIKKLGGEATVSKITGTSAATPYRWQYPKSAKGTGGLIPQPHHPVILAYAQRNGIELTAEDFLPPKCPQVEMRPSRPRKYAEAVA
ncbi:hypothetical protein V5F77_04215 [Xanthobacter sp. DSM 24535]|uniref:hypothetical protein n=1 Tax=Roseixanthobacter psychrophilus TaxID=3119917 RepID=UPI003729D696